jgi:dTDP-glucose 4,6-dehydratase
MRRNDGRAVPTFVDQALRGDPLTVHGDGSQTRSLCYVDDLVEGLWRLLVSDVIALPVNLGNPEEVKVLDLARTVVSLAGSGSSIVFTERPTDDPEVRCPDISRAASLLGWRPAVPLADGLQRTIDWARATWTPDRAVDST